MESGNDAAVTLAEYIGGDVQGFADLMNQKAISLNLSSSHFTSPHGLDHNEHYTTAYELALITDYALHNETFCKIVKTQSYDILINGHSKHLSNTNELLGYVDGVYGVKTGFTNGANRCLVSACTRDNIDIICIVLGCDTKKDRTTDSVKLINYIFKNYTLVNIKEIIENKFNIWKDNSSSEFIINKGVSQNPNIILDEAQIPYEFIAVNKSVLDEIEISFSYDSSFEAPLLSNMCIGYANVNIADSNSFKVQLLNNETICRKGIFYYINFFLKAFTFFDKNDILLNR